MTRPNKFILIGALGAIPALIGIGDYAATAPSDSDQAARGRYLVSISGCADCHTPKKAGSNGLEEDMSRWLSGHPEEVQLPPPEIKPGPWSAATAGLTAWAGPWGVSFAANLTPDSNTGLGAWTEEMFIRAIRHGKHMGYGRDILPPMPWKMYAQMTDDDLKAVFAYLRSIPPVKNRVPEPVPPGGPARFE